MCDKMAIDAAFARRFLKKYVGVTHKQQGRDFFSSGTIEDVKKDSLLLTNKFGEPEIISLDVIGHIRPMKEDGSL